MDSIESLWGFMGFYKSQWVLMVPIGSYESFCVFMNFNVSLWVYVDSNGSVWILIGP